MPIVAHVPWIFPHKPKPNLWPKTPPSIDLQSCANKCVIRAKSSARNPNTETTQYSRDML